MQVANTKKAWSRFSMDYSSAQGHLNNLKLQLNHFVSNFAATKLHKIIWNQRKCEFQLKLKSP